MRSVTEDENTLKDIALQITFWKALTRHMKCSPSKGAGRKIVLSSVREFGLSDLVRPRAI